MDVLTGLLAIAKSAPARWKSQRALRLPFVAVLTITFIVTIQLWTNYWPRCHQLWTDVVHDRNAHLELGLGLASDVAHGRVVEVVRDIDKAKTWPPLHDGLLVAGTMLATGMDVRFAVLPSLIGFAMTAVFAFLLAQRLIDGRNFVAGAVASILVLVSPAQRAFATDVMLESLGAGLTMATLYVAVRVDQDGELRDWRWLAIALSGLFFLKYNYWLLVVLALVIVKACELVRCQFNHEDTKARREHEEYRVLCASFVPLCLRGWISLLLPPLRQPFTWLIVLLAGVGLWIKWTGGTDIHLLGQTIPMRSPIGIATVTYWLVLLRLAPIAVRQIRNINGDLRINALLRWHVIPAALWLAWPQKLASFLWVLNPGDNVGEFPATNRWEGFRFLASALAGDYHIATWSCIVVAALVVIGLAAWVCRQLKPGATVVVLLMLLSIWLTATHPNRKSRFAHSWVPTLWVMAGVGVGVMVRRSHTSWQPAATVAGLTLAVVHMPGLVTAPHAPEGGLQLHRPSALTLTDAYLPYLENAQRPAILSNVPFKFLARWTYLDKYGRGVRPITETPEFNSAELNEDNAASFRRWLDKSNCDAIVYVDFPPGSPWYVPVPKCEGLEQLKVLSAGQDRMKLVATIDSIPGATINIYKKQSKQSLEFGLIPLPRREGPGEGLQLADH